MEGRHGRMNRPPRPPRMIPLAGDDNAAFHQWRDACQACVYATERHGCVEAGVLEYADGSSAGMSLISGGCDRWRGKV